VPPRLLWPVVARIVYVVRRLVALAARMAWASLPWRRGRAPADPRPELLRGALERLGGAWIKFGQILAMRVDYLPPAYIGELSRLLDAVPAMPWAAASRIVEETLGCAPEALFRTISPTPVASASFGQVYVATLHSGERVAVKVQRPGLEPVLTGDVLLLSGLAFVIDRLRLLGGIRLGPEVSELRGKLADELDYTSEAENVRRAHEANRWFRVVKVPHVYAQYSGTRVLTMEYLQGTWMTEILTLLRTRGSEGHAELLRRGIRPRLVARRIFDIGMRQIFEVGVFHADPHAANIVVLPGDRVGYVDFGIVGSMDESLTRTQQRYFEAVRDRRIDDAVDAVMELVVVPAALRERIPEFRRRLATRIRSWIDSVTDEESTLRRRSIGRLLLDTITSAREFGFSMVENAMLYYRTLITSDVTILQLDPGFDATAHLARYFRRRRIRELRQRMTIPQAVRTAADYMDLVVRAPGILNRLMEELEEHEETFESGLSRVELFFAMAARGALIALLAVLAARVLAGVADVAVPLGLPAKLDWRWLSLVLFVAWRTAVIFTTPRSYG